MCMPANTEQPRLRLRTEEFDRIARALLGVETDRQVAERLKVNTTTLSLIRSGKRFAPAGFIAMVMAEMPGVPLERLFEAVDRESAA